MTACNPEALAELGRVRAAVVCADRRASGLTMGHVEALAAELDCSVLETLTALQAAAAELRCEQTLEALCEMKAGVIERLGRAP